MALLCCIIFYALIIELCLKNKEYRIRRKFERQRAEEEAEREARFAEELSKNVLTPEQIEENKLKAKEAEYRKQLEKEGYSEELITVILPTIMNDGK